MNLNLPGNWPEMRNIHPTSSFSCPTILESVFSHARPGNQPFVMSMKMLALVSLQIMDSTANQHFHRELKPKKCKYKVAKISESQNNVEWNPRRNGEFTTFGHLHPNATNVNKWWQIKAHLRESSGRVKWPLGASEINPCWVVVTSHQGHRRDVEASSHHWPFVSTRPVEPLTPCSSEPFIFRPDVARLAVAYNINYSLPVSVICLPPRRQLLWPWLAARPPFKKGKRKKKKKEEGGKNNTFFSWVASERLSGLCWFDIVFVHEEVGG